MKKENLIKLINADRSIGFLASIDGEKPKVRPISAKYFEDKLLFATFTQSDKMKQIEKNSNVEMAWMFQDMSHLRFEGKIKNHKDEETKKRFLEYHHQLKKYFKNFNDPNYTLLEIEPSKVVYNSIDSMDFEKIDW